MVFIISKQYDKYTNNFKLKIIWRKGITDDIAAF